MGWGVWGKFDCELDTWCWWKCGVGEALGGCFILTLRCGGGEVCGGGCIVTLRCGWC